ncbi:hypothetical protein DIPPA_33962 [Diplonema papillatum]|nr:hypothetical protein DIPPA_33962 [Diplonema papillatum]
MGADRGRWGELSAWCLESGEGWDYRKAGEGVAKAAVRNALEGAGRREKGRKCWSRGDGSAMGDSLPSSARSIGNARASLPGARITAEAVFKVQARHRRAEEQFRRENEQFLQREIELQRARLEKRIEASRARLHRSRSPPMPSRDSDDGRLASARTAGGGPGPRVIEYRNHRLLPTGKITNHAGPPIEKRRLHVVPRTDLMPTLR